MSEYQYYHFRAIDRSLTPKEMRHLRDISSRADITPVSFVNEYNWGDLQADPRDLMGDFFDVHVYLSNWGTAVFMLRLPKEVFDTQTLNSFSVEPYFEIEALADYWLLIWSPGESGGDEHFDEHDGGNWMTRLVPLREELLRGDLRSLYIGWLRAVSEDDIEAEREPMALAGLGDLTAAQQALAEFLAIDPDLLAGVGASCRAKCGEEDAAARNAWLDKLPPDEVRGYLHQMLTGQGAQAERALRRSFADWRAKATAESGTAMCRTVEELWQLADQAQKVRLAREASAQKKAEAAERKRREVWLTKLAENFSKSWRIADKEAARGCAGAYDSVCLLLVDLRDAYDLQGNLDIFQSELEKFMAEHTRRKALVTRLEKIGLR